MWHHVWLTFGWIALLAVPALFLSAGISWVILEREEDAFGERPRFIDRGLVDRAGTGHAVYIPHYHPN